MKLRKLGRTALTVSEIGFGCGPTGGLLIRGTPAARREALACALDLGINYFDTAPGYGTGASESNLGESLQSLRASAVVATKVALDWDSLGDIQGFIERSVEDSLRRLRRQEVEIIQLHNRVAPQRAPRASAGTGALLALEDVLDAGGVLDAFERLRTRGLVRYLGCSAFGGDMSLVQRLIESGRIDLLTLHYSMLNRTAWSGPAGDSDGDYGHMGRRAAARGMGTVALRVLEGGAMLAVGDDAPTRIRSITAILAGARIDPAQGAVRFALSNPDVSTVLVGFSNGGQIRSAARCSDLGPLPESVLHLIEGV